MNERESGAEYELRREAEDRTARKVELDDLLAHAKDVDGDAPEVTALRSKIRLAAMLLDGANRTTDAVMALLRGRTRGDKDAPLRDGDPMPESLGMVCRILQGMLDDHGDAAPNYLQWGWRATSHSLASDGTEIATVKGYTVIIQHENGKSPNELKVEAEAARDALRVECDDAARANVALGIAAGKSEARAVAAEQRLAASIRATICPKCGSGILDGGHLADYPPCNGNGAVCAMPCCTRPALVVSDPTLLVCETHWKEIIDLRDALKADDGLHPVTWDEEGNPVLWGR